VINTEPAAGIALAAIHFKTEARAAPAAVALVAQIPLVAERIVVAELRKRAANSKPTG